MADDTDDGYCLDCGDIFRLDDTGGYNPPCRCGALCRSCCEHGRCEDDPTRDDEDYDAETEAP